MSPVCFESFPNSRSNSIISTLIDDLKTVPPADFGLDSQGAAQPTTADKIAKR